MSFNKLILRPDQGALITSDIFNGISLGEIGHITLRLVITIVLAGCIGWNRERRKQGAGFRTHILVGIAATSFMILGLTVSAQDADADPMRIIQGVAMGIGFLGAGTILQIPHEHRVQGLTTAASLWATSAIGLAVGAGQIALAAIVVVMTLIVLILLRKVEISPYNKKTPSSQSMDGVSGVGGL